MALLTATWKVTLGAVVLLDTTDYMLEEPRLQRSQANQQRRFVGADAVQNKGRKGVEHVLTFNQVRKHSTPADARAYTISQTKALPTEETTCLIRRSGLGTDDTLATAVLTGVDITSKNDQSIARYTISGGTLT